MNQSVYLAAMRAGCTHRQSEVLAWLCVKDKLADAATELGITESTAKNHLVSVRRKMKAPHTLAVVARLLS